MKMYPQFVTIGVITQKEMPLSRKMHQGIVDYTCRHPRWMLEFINRNNPAARNFKRHHFNGIIITGLYLDNILRTRRWKTPQVCISGSQAWSPADYPFPIIQTDNAAIARLAVEHLMRQGFRHMAFYRMPLALPEKVAWIRERQMAFAQCAQKAGHAGTVAIIMPDSICSADDVMKVTINWLRRLPLPVGIMAANDEHARTLLEACRALKLDVPRRVAIIGVDNDEFICNFTEPQLSSVIQNAERTGYEAARLLDRQMAGKAVKKQLTIPPKGIAIRQSTDCLAVDNPALRKAVDFIRLGPCNIRVTDVATAAGVSHATLNNLTRQLLGQTIHDLIATQRLRRARDLLLQTELPIKQVAAQVGFSSTQYMYTVFTRHENCTPGDYRRKYHHGEEHVKPVE